MGAKVTFDEINKIIQVTQAPDANGDIEIDVKTDLYSDGKEDWISTESLRKFQFPISAIGGNPLPGSKALGSTFFLRSDWKIKPYNGDHRLIVNGNFYSEDGEDIFLDPDGAYTIRIVQQVSSLVDSTVQQLEEIEYSSFDGAVTVDFTSSYSGTEYPVGTARQPVNNWADARSIADARGFHHIFINGSATLTSGENFDYFRFLGEAKTRTYLMIENGASITNCNFEEMFVEGYLDGMSTIVNCRIGTLNYVSGCVDRCVLNGSNITLSNDAIILDSYSGNPEDGTPVIDMAGSGYSLMMRHYSGDIEIQNKTGPETASIDLNTGHVLIDSTVTNGTVEVRGNGSLTDQSVGATIISENLVNPATVSGAVLNELVDSGIDVRAALKVLLAARAGIATGGGTQEIRFRDRGDTTDVIIMNVDENGNRSSVTLNVA